MKRYYYETHGQLKEHLSQFLMAYNFARRLKTLQGLTPYEHISLCWQKEPERFKLNPHHHNLGLNTYIVESYEDKAEGILGKDEEGKLAMTKVTLKPEVNFGGNAIPSREQVEELHHLAHEKCFIANSVKTKINIVQV